MTGDAVSCSVRISSRSCGYGDIETLAKNCSRRRCLDISNSEGISFRVVDYI